MTKGIDYELIDETESHIVLLANEPSRFEIMRCGEGILVYGYTGTKTDKKQAPSIVYDTCGEYYYIPKRFRGGK